MEDLFTNQDFRLLINFQKHRNPHTFCRSFKVVGFHNFRRCCVYSSRKNPSTTDVKRGTTGNGDLVFQDGS